MTNKLHDALAYLKDLEYAFVAAEDNKIIDYITDIRMCIKDVIIELEAPEICGE